LQSFLAVTLQASYASHALSHFAYFSSLSLPLSLLKPLFSLLASLKFCFNTCVAMKFVDDDDDDDSHLLTSILSQPFSPACRFRTYFKY